MKINTLFKGWNIMRWLRLILGITIAFQAYDAKDLLLGFLSTILLLQTATNTGCCGASSCNLTELNSRNPKPTDNIEFEEVK